VSWRCLLSEWTIEGRLDFLFSCLRMLAYSMDREVKLIDPGFSRQDWLAAHPAILGIRMKHWTEIRRLCLEGQYSVADSRSKLTVNNLGAESKIFNPTLILRASAG
jgi:hypothetical protein